ncbi:uncharacterized protein AKAME5_001666700 [Lates japonicus]|uniref:DNA-directed DNA polymerase n=1 Tax=Lates japonicus TaxID=270547 RepID=A0AAD3N3M9_LATJO|nr:uncharacterized protein AKAME5_001666700 [Lates japonicus]
MSGSKILSFKEPDYRLTFIDSLSFLLTRLNAMPKALDFTDQTKGYFPHKFSSENHLNYVGPYPPPLERMMACEWEEFDSWYGKGVTFGKLHADSEERVETLQSEHGICTIVVREHK